MIRSTDSFDLGVSPVKHQTPYQTSCTIRWCPAEYVDGGRGRAATSYGFDYTDRGASEPPHDLARADHASHEPRARKAPLALAACSGRRPLRKNTPRARLDVAVLWLNTSLSLQAGSSAFWLGGTDCLPGQVQDSPCTPAERVACPWDGGLFGVQVCSSLGSLEDATAAEQSSAFPAWPSLALPRGGFGAQVCGSGRQFDACECVPDLRCEPGTSTACICADGLVGARPWFRPLVWNLWMCTEKDRGGVLDFPDPTEKV